MAEKMEFYISYLHAEGKQVHERNMLISFCIKLKEYPKRWDNDKPARRKTISKRS
jgi:hypothetical protein